MLNRPNYNFDDNDLKIIATTIYIENSYEFETSFITSDMIYEVIKSDLHMNGYEYAKALENLGAEHIDSYIVEALESINNRLYHLNKIDIKKWVQDNNIKPKYNIGDFVKYESIQIPNSFTNKVLITNIDSEMALYSLKISDTSNLLVPFEKIEDKQ